MKRSLFVIVYVEDVLDFSRDEENLRSSENFLIESFNVKTAPDQQVDGSMNATSKILKDKICFSNIWYIKLRQ